MTFEDEEGSQVQAIMFNSDIAHFGDLFEPFHTYLVSVAQVKESSYAYGDSVNKFTWKIDLSTIVEPIEEVNPPEAPLPPPTRLSVTSFDAFEHIKVKESEFDVLAIVVNGEPPKYASNGKQIQEFIIMDNQNVPFTSLHAQSSCGHNITWISMARIMASQAVVITLLVVEY